MSAATPADQSRRAGAAANLRTVMEEFGELLSVLGAELGTCVQEADRDIVDLARAFHELAAANQRSLEIGSRDPRLVAVCDNCTQVAASLSEAVVALQCHDRLAQRIGHIRNGLEDLRILLRDGTARTCEDWLNLLSRVEASHRAEQARLMAVPTPPHGSAELF
jgi:hypothetical protein